MKPVIYNDIEQGTEEWLAIRSGIPTASMFSAVMAKGRGGPSKTRQKYMYQLAGEIITGEPMDNFSNAHMNRGNERENEAREHYEFVKAKTVEQVGFVRLGDIGCSPDGMVDDDGLAEFKDVMPHIQIERLLNPRVPPEYVKQVQGQLLVTGRKYCDFVSHSRGLNLMVFRAERDEELISAMKVDLQIFIKELNELVEKIKVL